MRLANACEPQSKTIGANCCITSWLFSNSVFKYCSSSMTTSLCGKHDKRLKRRLSIQGRLVSNRYHLLRIAKIGECHMTQLFTACSFFLIFHIHFLSVHVQTTAVFSCFSYVLTNHLVERSADKKAPKPLL